ncbi:MAG: mechanosensitive ion channel, partial [Alphaproteobacteria bacterium]|nr:mechanosensitive ion channel [Alphaproteobacteria bacterium]
APISDSVARRLGLFPTLIGISSALSAFAGGFDAAVGVSLAGQVVIDNAAVALEIGVVAVGLAAAGRARIAQLVAGESGGNSRLPWVLAALAGWLCVLTAIGADLLGYLAFSGFVIREAVWAGAVLALIFLVFRLVDEAIPTFLAPDHPMGAALETALVLSPEAIEQIGVLTSGLARLALLAFALVAVMAPFGASAGDIFGRVAPTSLVLHLGQVTISPGAVLGALALFLIGLFMTRAVRRWLERRYLPKTQLDMGVRTSLAIGVSYLGATIAIIVAFASLGLSLSQITLFASALSVGIGFGLQSIIGNFVSGLILLAERPVRVGDWVAIGDLEGDVRKISVRATEIEMADRSRLIVPNSELVTKTVRNVTHASATGRVRIVLKVTASADPIRVRDLLMARIAAHKDLLKQPAPGVFLTNVVDGALEFTCLAYVRSPRDAFRVKSELLFQIVPDLSAEGIALSSATTVVNLGLGERMIEPDSHPAPPPRKSRTKRPR